MNIKDQILQLLNDRPDLRDDDGKLSYNWWREFSKWWLEEFVKSNIQCSIRRYRQELQHKYEWLRGNKYYDDQIHAFKERKRRQQEKVEEKKSWLKSLLSK